MMLPLSSCQGGIRMPTPLSVINNVINVHHSVTYCHCYTAALQLHTVSLTLEILPIRVHLKKTKDKKNLVDKNLACIHPRKLVVLPPGPTQNISTQPPACDNSSSEPLVFPKVSLREYAPSLFVTDASITLRRAD